MARRRPRTGNERRAGKGSKSISRVMREYRRGTLESSSGAKVRKREQAVAIALSEARRGGARIPRPEGS